MTHLAFQLPGGYSFNNPAGFKAEFGTNGVYLGPTISQFINLGMFLTGTLLIFWMSWGIMQYIFAGGNKDRLASARKRIIFSIVGFVICLLSFLIYQFVRQIYTPQNTIIQPLTSFVPQAYAFDLSDVYGFGKIANQAGNPIADSTVGGRFTQLVQPGFEIAAVAVVIYFIFGAFKILTSGGDKEAVAGARAMITHAIVGFIMLILMFLVLKFLPFFFHLDFQLIG